MHRTVHQPPLLLSLLVAFLAAAAHGRGATGDVDVAFLEKADRLPNATVSSDGNVARVAPLLAALPDGHRLRIEFATRRKETTGFAEDVRYVRLVTTLDAGGKPDGQEVNYNDLDGHSHRTATYRKGVLDGLERDFDPTTGALTGERPWVNGKLHGTRRTFHPNGKPASETAYVKGAMHGDSRSFDAAGNLVRVVQFADDERDGTMTDYWPDKPDAIKQVIPYRRGKVHGVAQAFYLNGKPKWERPFRNNRQHGVETQYAVDGTVEKRLFWLDGNQVPAEQYREATGDRDAGQ